MTERRTSFAVKDWEPRSTTLKEVEVEDKERLRDQKTEMESTMNGIGDIGGRRQRRKFILCFDGTGNKFQGTAGDSNSECSPLLECVVL